MLDKAGGNLSGVDFPEIAAAVAAAEQSSFVQVEIPTDWER
jgi:hypothetical protein